MGFFGDHAVTRLGGEPAQIESNREGPQIKAFQLDRLGRHRQPLIPVIEIDACELFLERDEVLIDVVELGRGHGRGGRIELLGQHGQLALDAHDRVAQVIAQFIRCQLPATALGALNLAGQLVATLPRFRREPGERLPVATARHVSVDCNGQPQQGLLGTVHGWSILGQGTEKAGRGPREPCGLPVNRADPTSALDLGGRDRYPVAVDEHLVAGDRLPINSNEIVLGLGRSDLLLDELLDRRARGDFEVVGEPGVKLSTSITTRTRLQNRT